MSRAVSVMTEWAGLRRGPWRGRRTHRLSHRANSVGSARRARLGAGLAPRSWRAGWSPGSSPSGRLGQLRGRRCRPHRAGPCGEKVSRRARRVRSHALPQLWSREGAAFCSATRPLRPHSHVQHSMPALPCVDAFPGLRPRVELPGEPRSLPQCEPLPPGWGAGGARRWPGQGARQPRAPSPRPPATGPLASASSRGPEPEWGR